MPSLRAPVPGGPASAGVAVQRPCGNCWRRAGGPQQVDRVELAAAHHLSPDRRLRGLRRPAAQEVVAAVADDASTPTVTTTVPTRTIPMRTSPPPIDPVDRSYAGGVMEQRTTTHRLNL